MSDVPGVSPSTLKADLKDRLTAPIRYYRPLMLTGIPGVGKTAVVGQVCQALGIPFWTARPIQHETVEYTGLPTVSGDRAHWAPFEELLPVDPDWEGVIFVDEITQLDLPSQKIVASLLDKEGVAGRRIPAGARSDRCAIPRSSPACPPAGPQESVRPRSRGSRRQESPPPSPRPRQRSDWRAAATPEDPDRRPRPDGKLRRPPVWPRCVPRPGSPAEGIRTGRPRST